MAGPGVAGPHVVDGGWEVIGSRRPVDEQGVRGGAPRRGFLQRGIVLFGAGSCFVEKTGSREFSLMLKRFPVVGLFVSGEELWSAESGLKYFGDIAAHRCSSLRSISPRGPFSPLG